MSPGIVKLPDGNDTWLYEGRLLGVSQTAVVRRAKSGRGSGCTGRCQQAAKLAALFIRRGWDGAGLRPCGPDCAVSQVHPRAV